MNRLALLPKMGLMPFDRAMLRERSQEMVLRMSVICSTGMRLCSSFTHRAAMLKIAAAAAMLAMPTSHMWCLQAG